MNKEQRQSVENLLRTTVVGREMDLAFWNEADSKTARQEAVDCESDIAAYRAALAILTDEAESDRVLGARVREIGVSARVARWSDRRVLRAIADALREEGGR